MFHRRKSVIQVWNDTRGSKWWQNFHRFFSIALRDLKMSMEIKNGKYISGTQTTRKVSGHCCTLSYCLLWLSSEIFVLYCPMFYRHLAIWNRPGLKCTCRATIENLDLLPLPCLYSKAIWKRWIYEYILANYYCCPYQCCKEILLLNICVETVIHIPKTLGYEGFL